MMKELNIATSFLKQDLILEIAGDFPNAGSIVELKTDFNFTQLELALTSVAC